MTPEEIVRALADDPAPRVVDSYTNREWCGLCSADSKKHQVGGVTAWTIDHEPYCPWLMAHNWVKENK